MTALLIFHLKAGIRIAVRSFAPLFSAILALIMLNIDPVATVTGLAITLFARRPVIGAWAPFVLLAFLLPAWAAPKLLHGLNGWIRHLPFHSANNRRGMLLALVTTQMPLAFSLACLAFVAHSRGVGIVVPSLRWLLVLASGALASLAVKRRIVTIPFALISAQLALLGDLQYMVLAMAVLMAAEAAAGPLREFRHQNPWQPADRLLSFRIAWRALGWRTSAIYVAGLLPMAATALFIRNNDLSPSLAAGAARLGGSMAVVIVLAGMADRLALRRPAWPLARSLPWSASQRVAMDALFLGGHGLLPIFLLAVPYPGAAICALAALPFLALRSTGHLRRVPRQRTGAGPLLVEGFAVAALLALLPWTAFLCLAAIPAACVAARTSEQALKVTCWSDLHHTAFGDTLSWSEE